jgi:hypothetical protein
LTKLVKQRWCTFPAAPGSSTVRRKEIRRRLHDGLLRHLVTVANAAADEQPAT